MSLQWIVLSYLILSTLYVFSFVVQHVNFIYVKIFLSILCCLIFYLKPTYDELGR